MSSVDDRIVNMQFNNKQFVQGASDSQKALEGLDRTLANTAKGQGLTNLSSGVEQVTGRFSAMRIAGISAIATIASKATAAGLTMLKSLTIDPIMQGFQEYQTNLTSTQIIMANTGKSVKVVGVYLNELNRYSDQTIYNFSQMASSIGKFTAAGVKLPQATSAIKGMANAAALSGADVNQLNSAMYQMSQALASGTIKLIDWNSMVNANMGGKNIQKTLLATAAAMGPVSDAVVAATNGQMSFKDSLQDGWLTAGVFTKAMNVMAGKENKLTGETEAYSVAQLMAMNYTKEQAIELHKLSKAAIKSATDIKTFPQLMDVLKESVGSGFAQIFEAIFGNLKQSIRMWTAVGDTIKGAMDKVFGSIATVLAAWRKAGGYAAMWNGFANIFKTIGNILGPFVTAFASLLPAGKGAGKGLATASKAFESFTGWLERSTRGVSVITPYLVKVFSVFKMGAQVVGFLLNALKPLAPVLNKVVDAAANMLSQGAKMASDLINGLLGGLDPGAIKAAVVNWANSIIDWIKGVFGISSPSTVMMGIGENMIAGFVDGFLAGMKELGKAMGQLIGTVMNGMTGLFKDFDAMDWAGLVNAVLAGGLLLTGNKIVSWVTLGQNALKSLTGVIDEVGSSLKAWQNSLKAKMILDIAIAIGILTASVIALSFVDPKKLATGLGAITAMLGALAGTLFILSKIESDKQMLSLAGTLFIIAAAMTGIAIALTILGQQDPKKVATGVGMMAFALTVLIAALYGLSLIKGSIEGMAGSILVIAIAMNVLAGAIAMLGNMDFETLRNGIGALAYAMAILVVAMLGMDKMKKSPEGLAASIFVLASAMVVLASAVAAFGNMDWETLKKGFAAVTAGLILMVGAIMLVSLNSEGALASAGAIAILAVALGLLANVILVLGNADWQTLALGLGAIAVALILVLGAAALSIGLAPGLEVLASAVLAIGGAFALAGLGMLAFATGLSVLAAVGAAGIAVMVLALEAFLAMLPTIAQQLGLAFVSFVKVLANNAITVAAAFGKISRAILNEIIKLIPKFGELFAKLVATGLKVLNSNIGAFAELGWKTIDEFLKAADRHVPSITDSAIGIVKGFLGEIGKHAQEIATTGIDFILDVVNGFSNAIRDKAADIRAAAFNLVTAFLSALTGGLSDRLGGAIADGLKGLGGAVGNAIGNILGRSSDSEEGKAFEAEGMSWGKKLAEGLARGIIDNAAIAVAAAVEMANAIISEGNAEVAKAQKAASSAQHKANKKAAKAQLRAEEAEAKRKEANKYAKEHKRDKKGIKARRKAAAEAQKDAEKAQKAADAEQKKADKAKKHVEDVKAFEAADYVGKGDIRNQQAVAMSEKADKMLAKAQTEAAEARKLMKTNKKAGRALLEQARKDAKEAARLAAEAEKKHAEAEEWYQKELAERIQAMKDQAEYEAADTAGKIAILQRRAAAHEEAAKQAKADAAALLAQAEAMAATDAAEALRLMEQAEEAAARAEEAAQAAEDERRQAEELAGGGASGTGGTGGSIAPSRSILEDAASAVDRYTESLMQAQELAAAQQGPIQFIQNNTSPKALTASEIYRQSKSLLTAAEIKMGVTSSP